MAVVWQASGTLLGSTGADITPVNPAHQADDILILHAAARSNSPTLATPSGWTLKSGPNDQGTTWRHYLFWRRATAPGTTNPLCDWSSTTGDKYGVVHNLRGAVTSGDPFEALAFTGGTASPGVATGVTSLTAGALICSIGMSSDNTLTAVAATATDPTSLTQQDFEAIPTGSDAAMWISTANRTNAGATGNVSHAWTGAQATWGIYVAAIKEAPTVVNVTATVGAITLALAPQAATVYTAHPGPMFALKRDALGGGSALKGATPHALKAAVAVNVTATVGAGVLAMAPQAAQGLGGALGDAAARILSLAPQAPAVLTGAVGPAAARVLSLAPQPAAAVGEALVPVSARVLSLGPQAAQGLGGGVFPVSARILDLSPLTLTAEGGTGAPVSAAPLQMAPQAVSVVGEAVVALSARVLSLAPQPSAGLGSALAPISARILDLAPQAVFAEGGVGAPVSARVLSLAPQAVSVVGEALVPVSARILSLAPQAAQGLGGLTTVLTVRNLTMTPEPLQGLGSGVAPVGFRVLSLAPQPVVAFAGDAAVVGVITLDLAPQAAVGRGGGTFPVAFIVLLLAPVPASGIGLGVLVAVAPPVGAGII